jgi:hypothetical protein
MPERSSSIRIGPRRRSGVWNVRIVRLKSSATCQQISEMGWLAECSSNTTPTGLSAAARAAGELV